MGVVLDGKTQGSSDDMDFVEFVHQRSIEPALLELGGLDKDHFSLSEGIEALRKGRELLERELGDREDKAFLLSVGFEQERLEALEGAQQSLVEKPWAKLMDRRTFSEFLRNVYPGSGDAEVAATAVEEHLESLRTPKLEKFDGKI